MTKSIADKSVTDLTKEIDKLKKVAKDLEDVLPEKTPVSGRPYQRPFFFP